jgi:formyl-CoA transferase
MAKPMLPLADIKVVELGTMVTAPLAAMLMAQLGADVTKVENPSGGDPFRKSTADAYSPNFLAYNQNKKSIRVDLATAEGKAGFLELLATADVLIENFRPGVMDRLGLSANVLSKSNPKLIHCSITGFGPDGPYCARPAYDTVGIALSGILHLYLNPEKPQIFGPTLADNVTGLYAFGGILAALHARQATGKSQRVELNILESAIAFAPDAFAYSTQLGESYGPLSRVAASQSFVWNCADGKAISVHLSVPEKFWFALLDALDARSTIGQDPRFLTPRERVENYQELAERLGDILKTKPRAHWEQTFTAHDVPFAPVHDIADVMQDPQVKHLGTFEETEHPTKGKVVGIRSPIRINGVRPTVSAPPTLGEHEARVFGATAGIRANAIPTG